MKRTILVAALCLFAAWPAGAAEKPLWQLVPADGLGLVVLPDLGRTRAALKQSNIYRLFAEPELKALIDALRGPLQDKLDQARKEFEKQTGITVEQALQTLNGEVGLAFLGLDEKQQPRFLLSLEFGKNLAVIQTLLGRFQKMVAGGEQPQVTSVDHGGTKISSIAGRRGGLGASWCLAGERLLLSAHSAVLAGALDRLQGKAEGGLGAGAIGDEAGRNLLLYVDIAQVLRRFEKQIPEEAKSVLAALGIADWQSLYYASGLSGGQFSDTLRIRTSGKRRGLTCLLQPGAVSDGSLQQMVPREAVGAAFGRFDPAGTWRQALQAVKAIDRGTYGKLTEGIARFEERCGTKLDRLLDSIGTHYLSHSVMPEAGLFPRTVTRFELVDPSAFLAGLRGLARGAKSELVQAEYRGQTIYHLRAQLGKLGDNPFGGANQNPAAVAQAALMFLPAHVYLDGKWAVFGGTHQHLLDEIDRAARHEAAGQVALPRGTGLYARSDTSKVMAGLYNTVLPLLTGIEGLLRVAGIPYDARHLPRASTLVRHLGRTSYLMLSGDERTITITGTSSLGAAPLLVAGAAAVGVLVGARPSPDSGKLARPPVTPRPLPEGPVKRVRIVRQARHPAVGTPAGDFTLTTPDGRTVKLSKLRGQVVLIDFWATWCGPCKRVMPHLQKLHAAYAGKSVRVLGVNVWDEKGKAEQYMKQQGYGYDLLLDGDEVARRYGVKGIPTLFVVGPQGKVRYVHVGYSERVEQELRQVIERTLAGK